MSSKSKRRQELEAALNAAMRDVSGQGVLYSQAVAERLRMNSTDLECLDHILRGPVTAGRLAEVTGLTTGAITGVIDRLERVGLARRERDLNDRRKILVRVLPAVGERVAPLFEPMERTAMAVLSTYRDDETCAAARFPDQSARCRFDRHVGASRSARASIKAKAAQGAVTSWSDAPLTPGGSTRSC
jgi:DNA-binding MarR family transcriptional regulator